MYIVHLLHLPTDHVLSKTLLHVESSRLRGGKLKSHSIHCIHRPVLRDRKHSVVFHI